MISLVVEERLMWFKTRTGLCSISEPCEIRVAKYPKANPPCYWIVVRYSNYSKVDYKGIFGKFSGSGRDVYLVRFLIAESSAAEIAECMKAIESAIATGTNICDLSAFGDGAAQSEDWHVPIEW